MAKTNVMVGVAFALVLAACGDTGGGTVAVGRPGDAATTPAATAGSDEPQTLEEFFGFGEDFDEAAQQAEFEDQQRLLEEQVATCMRALGWEYTPVDYSQFDTYQDPFADLSEEEFREQYGYGISTFLGIEDELFGGPDVEFVDPNQEYVMSLTPVEQEAFYADLHGVWEEPEIDPDTGEYPNDYFGPETGCYPEAEREIYGNPGETFGALDEAFMELEQRIQSDSRMVEALAGWSTCMQEGGYSFSTFEDAFIYLDEKMQPIWEQDYVEPFEGMSEAEIEEFFATTSPEEQEDFFRQFEPDFDTPEVRAIQAEELTIAALDNECRAAHVGDLEDEVRKDYEAQFIAENRELLEQMRDRFR
jgi:hypothetical protein